MKTPQTMTRFSASLSGMTPAATLSVTALATAAWAGPNICTACVAPLIVTLVMSTVAGLQTRFGVSTASRFEWPGLLVGQGVGEGHPHRAVLVADQQIDVRDLVAVADQRFTDVHRHGRFSLGVAGLLCVGTT